MLWLRVSLLLFLKGIVAAAPAPAPASVPDGQDLEAEVAKLKSRFEEEHTARMIAQTAALGAMQESADEAKLRKAAQASLGVAEAKLRPEEAALAAAQAKLGSEEEAVAAAQTAAKSAQTRADAANTRAEAAKSAAKSEEEALAAAQTAAKSAEARADAADNRAEASDTRTKAVEEKLLQRQEALAAADARVASMKSASQSAASVPPSGSASRPSDDAVAAAQAHARAADALAAAADARSKAAEAKLLQGQEALAAADARLDALQAALQKAGKQPASVPASVPESAPGIGMGRFGDWLQQLHEQRIPAAVAVLLGLLSVLGPTAGIDFIFAAAGSACGGLLLGSGLSYFATLYGKSPPTPSSSLRWLDVLIGLMHGKGDIAGFSAWAIWTLLGVARHLSGCKCRMVAWAPEVKLHADSGQVETPFGQTTLNVPLIGDTPRSRNKQGTPGRSEPPQELPSARSSRSRDNPSPRPSDRSNRDDDEGGGMSARSRDTEGAGRSRGSNGEGRNLPKPMPSKSSGIIARLGKEAKAIRASLSDAGSSHNSGRPGGAANV